VIRKFKEAIFQRQNRLGVGDDVEGEGLLLDCFAALAMTGEGARNDSAVAGLPGQARQ
jgi:hypothetical protein